MSEEPPSRRSPAQGLLARLLATFRDDKPGRDQLVEHIHDAEAAHVIDTDTAAMMEGALLVSEMKVRDIMVPRSEIVFIDEEMSAADFLPEVIESGHSRFPVFDHEREHVLGVLLAKDLLMLASDSEQNFDIRDILRPVSFVPESKRLNILLREFRARRNHLAVVVDEYGDISGLVTIEDVIEQIVGEIDDEHDLAEEDNIRRHRDERYTVKARTTLEEFNEFFELDWSSGDYDTIGGLVIHELGHLPRRGEELEHRGFSFKVLRADRRRVRLLRVIRLAAAPALEEA
ncbi:MAG: CBS domain-containing protein [Gammaproteobacteria bacterium]|nr:CBS domain-containing protein [Gammaproteobacteria bacterium]MCP5200742.1 CBS domain-containing protein [Gammaproteobacteria bacterium]